MGQIKGANLPQICCWNQIIPTLIPCHWCYEPPCPIHCCHARFRSMSLPRNLHRSEPQSHGGDRFGWVLQHQCLILSFSSPFFGWLSCPLASLLLSFPRTYLSTQLHLHCHQHQHYPGCLLICWHSVPCVALFHTQFPPLPCYFMYLTWAPARCLLGNASDTHWM